MAAPATIPEEEKNTIEGYDYGYLQNQSYEMLEDLLDAVSKYSDDTPGKKEKMEFLRYLIDEKVKRAKYEEEDERERKQKEAEIERQKEEEEKRKEEEEKKKKEEQEARDEAAKEKKAKEIETQKDKETRESVNEVDNDNEKSSQLTAKSEDIGKQPIPLSQRDPRVAEAITKYKKLKALVEQDPDGDKLLQEHNSTFSQTDSFIERIERGEEVGDDQYLIRKVKEIAGLPFAGIAIDHPEIAERLRKDFQELGNIKDDWEIQVDKYLEEAKLKAEEADKKEEESRPVIPEGSNADAASPATPQPPQTQAGQESISYDALEQNSTINQTLKARQGRLGKILNIPDQRIQDIKTEYKKDVANTPPPQKSQSKVEDFLDAFAQRKKEDSGPTPRSQRSYGRRLIDESDRRPFKWMSRYMDFRELSAEEQWSKAGLGIYKKLGGERLTAKYDTLVSKVNQNLSTHWDDFKLANQVLGQKSIINPLGGNSSIAQGRHHWRKRKYKSLLGAAINFVAQTVLQPMKFVGKIIEAKTNLTIAVKQNISDTLRNASTELSKTGLGRATLGTGKGVAYVGKALWKTGEFLVKGGKGLAGVVESAGNAAVPAIAVSLITGNPWIAGGIGLASFGGDIANKVLSGGNVVTRSMLKTSLDGARVGANKMLESYQTIQTYEDLTKAGKIANFHTASRAIKSVGLYATVASGLALLITGSPAVALGAAIGAAAAGGFLDYQFRKTVVQAGLLDKFKLLQKLPLNSMLGVYMGGNWLKDQLQLMRQYKDGWKYLNTQWLNLAGVLNAVNLGGLTISGVSMSQFGGNLLRSTVLYMAKNVPGLAAGSARTIATSAGIGTAVGTAAGIATALLLGVPLGGAMLLGAAIGGIVGGVIGVGISFGVAGATGGIGAGASFSIIAGTSWVFSTFGAWLGSKFDEWLGKAVGGLTEFLGLLGVWQALDMISKFLSGGMRKITEYVELVVPLVTSIGTIAMFSFTLQNASTNVPVTETKTAEETTTIHDSFNQLKSAVASIDTKITSDVSARQDHSEYEIVSLNDLSVKSCFKEEEKGLVEFSENFYQQLSSNYGILVESEKEFTFKAPVDSYLDTKSSPLFIKTKEGNYIQALDGHFSIRPEKSNYVIRIDGVETDLSTGQIKKDTKIGNTNSMFRLSILPAKYESLTEAVNPCIENKSLGFPGLQCDIIPNFSTMCNQ